MDQRQHGVLPSGSAGGDSVRRWNLHRLDGCGSLFLLVGKVVSAGNGFAPDECAVVVWMLMELVSVKASGFVADSTDCPNLDDSGYFSQWCADSSTNSLCTKCAEGQRWGKVRSLARLTDTGCPLEQRGGLVGRRCVRAGEAVYQAPPRERISVRADKIVTQIQRNDRSSISVSSTDNCLQKNIPQAFFYTHALCYDGTSEE